MLESRLVRLWVILSVFSMLLYSLVQMINSFIGAGYHLGFGAVAAVIGLDPTGYAGYSSLFLWGHFFPEISLIMRFIGLCLIFVSVCLMLVFRKSWINIKRGITLGVFLESLFILCFLATIPMLLNGINLTFAVSYGLQVLFAAPPLLMLVWYIGKKDSSTIPWRCVGLAIVGYFTAILINNFFRIFSPNMLGIAFPFERSTLGIFAATILLPLELGFAIAGFFSILKPRNNGLTTKLFAGSFVLLGSYFSLYIVYSALIGALNFVMLVEIWAAPLLGLGLSLLYKLKKAS